MMLEEALVMTAIGMVFGVTVGSIVGHYITEAIMGLGRKKKEPEHDIVRGD